MRLLCGSYPVSRPSSRHHLPPLLIWLLIEASAASSWAGVRQPHRRLVMSLVLLLAASEGHVRMNYIDGSDLPIRNANTADGNGRVSVAGGLVLSKHELRLP